MINIKELAEQAGFQYIKDEGIGWAGNHNSSLPKFAELIVRECIDNVKVWEKDSRNHISYMLKQHFGVEDESIKAGADIHAGDGGYEIGTQEAYDEFVKIRNAK